MSMKENDTTLFWDRTLKKIKARLNNDMIFDNFFRDTYIDHIDGNAMFVVCPNALSAMVLGTTYKTLVDKIVTESSESIFDIHFIEKPSTKTEAKIQIEKPAYFADNYISPQYTFKSFVVGQSNLEASQASIIVANNPGNQFNPLLIYGDSGLGKTHLLQAIGNEIREKKPNLKILYVHAQDFFQEFVKYTQGQKDGKNFIDWFKESVDVLLVDDVQFLANKRATEESFFTIYNNMYAAGKQVVLTSDMHPSKLNGLDERLKTRFVQGLPVSVGAPDEAMCQEILKLRIQANNLDVNDFDPDAIGFFAKKFGRNVRELEGAFDRLLFYTVNIVPTKHITLKIAMDSVRSLIDIRDEEARLSEERIINTVAEYYNIPAREITGKIRTSQIALARHISMYLIRTLLDVPFVKIGQIFGGKDHATVMSGVQKVEKGMKVDADLKKAVTELTERLKK